MEQKKEKSFSTISVKSFLVVVILLSCIILLCGILSYVIPQGSFERDAEGVIINGTFILGERNGIAIWRVITAPARVFFSEDGLTISMICLFLLIMSGVFNLLEKTGGVKVIIDRTVKKFSSRKKQVICIITLIFMLFGSFFGMFEELVTLLPLIILLMLSMGFDTLTGLGVCMLASCFGFSAAITNPFSVGLASSMAKTHVFDGAWLRILFFAVIYVTVCVFLLLHTRKIQKEPTYSLTFAIDEEKRSTLEKFDTENKNENKLFKVFLIFFLAQFVALILIASIRQISGLAIPILSVSFLLGGIIAGLCVCEKKKDVFRYLLQGAVSMLPAVFMIALASSVKLIMVESNIMDTVMYKVISFLEGKSKFVCIIFVYFLILFLQVFIGSASAKIILIMPIILPIAEAIGLSSTIVIFTYCIADGFTDMILPTNPVLLIGLSMANVSYGKWAKWTWKIQLFLFSFTLLLLLFAVKIGY